MRAVNSHYDHIVDGRFQYSDIQMGGSGRAIYRWEVPLRAIYRWEVPILIRSREYTPLTDGRFQYRPFTDGRFHYRPFIDGRFRIADLEMCCSETSHL